MKGKVLFTVLFAVLCCLSMPVKASAMTGSDIRIRIQSLVNSLDTESGVVAVEQFPAEIAISMAAETGTLTTVRMEHNGQMKEISAEYLLRIEGREGCGAYTITACTDQGAVLTVTVNIIFQVKATYEIRYRTVAMNLSGIYSGGELVKEFPSGQYIRLKDANTIAEGEKERIAGLIGKKDGRTYLLKGSLVVEVYDHASGKRIGTYDTGKDFEQLTAGFNWTPNCYSAFDSMRDTALSYQAPVKISVEAVWCDEKKQEIYGTITAQEKGIPEYLYPYQTASVTFAKDDILLSRNFIYTGLEWEYIPETEEYQNGESKDRTEITQPINTRIPATEFFFKFKKTEGSDLSVNIQAPKAVGRGEDYSFTVTYNNGSQQVYDAVLEGKVDKEGIREIPERQDFNPGESRAYKISRTADTSADEIHLWAHIGIPDGVIDDNPDNNTAEIVIRIIDPEPEAQPSPTPGSNPDDRGDSEHTGDPPDLPKACDLSVSISAPSAVYEQEDYSYTIYFVNLSGMALDKVPVHAKCNEAILGQLPEEISLLPQETKSYTYTSTAGKAGEEYQLWAEVGVPEGFEDENPVDNTATAKTTVLDQDNGNPDDPDNPEPSGTPDNPDTPETPNHPRQNECDLWVNLSYPPEVYEEEEYSVTVYFTNHTDRAVSNVKLASYIDGVGASTIPSHTDFKANETKSYLLKGSAGQKGSLIRLLAQVWVPDGYYDSNQGNNRAEAEITVKEHPFDLDVQRITPDTYKENQTVVSTIRISNTGSLDFAPGEKVTVLFEIPELSLKKTVDAIVMKKDTWNTVSVKWDTPNVQKDTAVMMKATVSSGRPLGNESSSENNTYTQCAVIKNVSYDTPDEATDIPVPPQRSAVSKVTWWEQRYENGKIVWKSFYAELKVSATLTYETMSKGYIKSGYGFGIQVNTTVDTNYDKPELITKAQTAEVYLPQYRYETAIPLLGEEGTFTFRENSASPFGYKKQYVPVWFPDNRDYIVQLYVTDVYTPAGILSKWITGGSLQMKVADSMYSDDATTGGK